MNAVGGMRAGGGMGVGAGAGAGGYPSGGQYRPGGGGGGAQRQWANRPPPPQNQFQRAGIQPQDGCVYWTGRDGTCTRPACRFQHPAGVASAANQKYVQAHGGQPQPPQQRRN